MHIIISKDELLKACQNVVGAVERKQTLPILSHVLLVAEEKGDRLFSTATDLELELKSFGFAKNIITPGKITVSARKLLDICRSLPKESEIEMKLEGGQLILKSGKRIFNLLTLPANEYPNIEELADKKTSFQLTQAEFKKILSKTSFAIPQQDVRYFLNGMLFEVESGKINFVATDGHRLAFAGANVKTGEKGEKTQVIVPRKTMFELSSLLKDEDKEIKVFIYNNHVVIESDDFKMTSKLIDGKYPNYNRVIPQNCNKTISVDTAGMKVSLGCVSVLANESFRGMRMFLTNNLLKMSANNSQQEEADENIEIDYQGPDVEMAFNIDYLIDICGILHSGQFVINFSDADSPVMIEEDYVGVHYIYVVMPMRI